LLEADHVVVAIAPDQVNEVKNRQLR